jgi:O-antigen ligase
MMGLLSLENERSLSQFKWTIVLSTGSLMLIGMLQYFTAGLGVRRVGSLSDFAGPNELGAVIVMTLPFAWMLLFRRAPHALARLGGCVFAAFSLLVIWYTRSRGALLSLAIQCIAALSLKGLRKKWLPLLLLSGLLGVGYLGLVRVIPRSPEDMAESEESRIIYWKAAIAMVRDRPLWGVGFNQYREHYETYSSSQRFESGKRTAHSSWLLPFAEGGFPGGLLYIAFFLMVLRTAWRHRYRWPDQFCALVGFAVGMSFLSITYSLYFYILAGLILASDSARRRSLHAV